MNYLHILILAIIQGAAELLPVSSSAHVIVAARLLQIHSGDVRFHFLLIMLHTGTMFAVLVYFWPRWKPMLWPSVSDRPSNFMTAGRFLAMVALATIATGVIGYGLKELIEKVFLEHFLGHKKAEIEELFNYLPLIAASLFTVGLLILVAGLREKGAESQTISPQTSLWIGVVQGLCLPFRGFSRSGATISTALLCGVNRPLSEDFCFALAIVLTPAVIVRELYRLRRDALAQGADTLSASPAHIDWLELLTPGLVGMVFSFLAGLLALKLLSAVLEKGQWRFFAYYCFLAAAAVLAIHFTTGTAPSVSP